jgi:hypothetical protein
MSFVLTMLDPASNDLIKKPARIIADPGPTDGRRLEFPKRSGACNRTISTQPEPKARRAFEINKAS